MKVYKMGYKEEIVELLKENELGLKYNTLLTEYKEKYNKELENGYIYLQRLKKDGLVKTYIPEDRKGKIIAYKLTTKAFETNNVESDDLNDKLVLLMIKARINSEIYGIDIREKEIESSLKRLKESGKIG